MESAFAEGTKTAFRYPDGHLNFVPFAALSGNGQDFVMADFYAKALATGKAWETLAEVQRDWFVKRRNEKGMLTAVRDAGPPHPLPWP